MTGKSHKYRGLCPAWGQTHLQLDDKAKQALQPHLRTQRAWG